MDVRIIHVKIAYFVQSRRGHDISCVRVLIGFIVEKHTNKHDIHKYEIKPSRVFTMVI